MPSKSSSAPDASTAGSRESVRTAGARANAGTRYTQVTRVRRPIDTLRTSGANAPRARTARAKPARMKLREPTRSSSETSSPGSGRERQGEGERLRRLDRQGPDPFEQPLVRDGHREGRGRGDRARDGADDRTTAEERGTGAAGGWGLRPARTGRGAVPARPRGARAGGLGDR